MKHVPRGLKRSERSTEMVFPATAFASSTCSTVLLSERGGSGEEDNDENGDGEDFEKKGVLQERRRREDVCVSNLLSIVATQNLQTPTYHSSGHGSAKKKKHY